MPDIVRYSSHGLNNEPFNDQTTFDHLNTEQVRYSDPHCITEKNTFPWGFKKSKLLMVYNSFFNFEK